MGFNQYDHTKALFYEIKPNSPSLRRNSALSSVSYQNLRSGLSSRFACYHAVKFKKAIATESMGEMIS